MKKSRIALIVVVLLMIVGLILGGVYMILQRNAEYKAVSEAEAAQAAAHDRYTALLNNVDESSVTVTEAGRVIGVYSVEQLGLAEGLRRDAGACFDETEQMSKSSFVQLTAEEKLAWRAKAQRSDAELHLRGDLADVSAILLDLNKEIRRSAKNAYAFFENGAYVIQPEIPGTQLEEDVVEGVLRRAISESLITPGSAAAVKIEVTQWDIYREAEITGESSFDYRALLAEDADGVVIPVKLLNQERELEVSAAVQTDETGVVQADQKALEQLVAQWAEECRAVNAPYILNSYVEGPVALEFLPVTYELNQPVLVSMLAEQVKRLDDTPVEAPFYCTRRGEPFALEGTYVEVDVDNQQMTFFKDGAVVVNTDVVTGYPWGFWTPPGLYAVQNKDTDCWLKGDDYNVFVKYWVGFHGAYGIHDASWRTIFGGQKYRSDGSHGCVNTPEEAMEKIFAQIEVGVPVVVHDVPDET